MAGQQIVWRRCEKATDEEFVLSVYVERSIGVVHLDFGKAFDIISHSFLLEKLAAPGMDGCTLPWAKNSGWLDPESGGGWNYIQLIAGPEWCSPGLSTGTSYISLSMT